MAAQQSKRLAVLIDADNISAKYADALFRYISKLGDAKVRRLYGNFSGDNLQSWKSRLADFSLKPWRVSQKATGKNAADISLVVNAMDLLHSGEYDAFCIVSSDSDFTHLARRIQESGCDVYGFGERKTPDSFISACQNFVYVSTLKPPSNAERKIVKPKRKPKSETYHSADSILRKAIEENSGKSGWVEMRHLDGYIRKHKPDFSVRDFNYSKLSTLIKNLSEFEMAGRGQGLRVRVRPPKTS